MKFHTAQTLLNRITTLSRDKLDTLLLVVTGSVILAPLARYSPLWIDGTAVLLLTWRIWLTVSGKRLPEKWQITLTAVVLSLLIYLHFHTWLGKDAGMAFLIVLVCMKMLELHARRDAAAVVLVCYFLLVGQLLYSQSLLSGLYLLLCTGLLISTQMAFQYHRLTPTLGKRLMSGYRIVGLAIPLALVLFLFFPRIQGPLWGKPQENGSAITGLSDFMEPGNVAELALSDQIAFRVRFHEHAPPPNQLYWRGIVLDTFDGKRWSARAPHVPTMPARPDPNHAVTQDIVLEPHNRHWLFGLDLPVYLSSYNGAAADINDNQYAHLTRYTEMRSETPVNDRTRYSLVSNVGDPASRVTVTPLTAREQIELQIYGLQIPAGLNPQTFQWAQQLREQTTNPIELANKVLHYFREQPFRYTLAPPELGINQIDDFMFKTQAGFCEHYASAFVLIMRDLKIPARVVTGYQGGEINPVDHWMTVRQSDAHAWAEIWVDGWIRVDPTAAVAPNRVELGLNGSFPNRHLSGLLNFSQQSWLGNIASMLQQQWDAVNSGWNLWVLNYNLGKQLNLLGFLSGIENPQAAESGMAMMIGATLMGGILSLLLLVRKKGISPVDRVYLKFCRHMGRHGYERMAHEGPNDYCHRLEPVFRGKHAIVDFLTLYSECKYGRGYNADQLSTLNKLLSLCLQLKPAHDNSSSSLP